MQNKALCIIRVGDSLCRDGADLPIGRHTYKKFATAKMLHL